MNEHDLRPPYDMAKGARGGGGSPENSSGWLGGGGGGGGGDNYPEVSTSMLIGDKRCAIGGSTELGGVTKVKGLDPSAGQFQWSRVNPADGAQTVIKGATRHQYAPEPAGTSAHRTV